MKKLLLLIALCLTNALSFTSYAQTPTPAPTQKEPVVLKNATIHVGDGKTVLEKASIRFENGKITEIGQVSEENAKVIDVQGKHIYPSLILPNTTLGLREIDAVRPSLDYEEVGDINPNVRAISAYNTESEVTATVRCNGVLIAQATPRGKLVAGLSSVVVLDAWTWEDAALSLNDGLHVYMPPYIQSGGWWATPAEPQKAKDEERNADIHKIKKLLVEAKAYNEATTHETKNLKLDAIKGLFDGSMRLYLHANWAKDIIEGVELVKNIGVKKVVIVGGYDAWQIVDFLKKHDVALIVKRTLELPQRTDDDIDMPFKLPYLLEQAGIKYCLDYEGDMEAMGARNLPFSAGMTVAFGLTKEQALAAITSRAAQILGIDDRVGTLEIGKQATLVVSEGDILDITTNNIQYAFIDGRALDLSNRQQILYKKYKTRIEESQE